MSQKDVSDYVIECAKIGITNHEAICVKAKEEIEEIKRFLHEADTKRIKMTKLMGVLQVLGDESIKRRKIQPTLPVIESDNDVEAAELRISICNILESTGIPMTNRDIIQAVGKYKEDQKVFRAIKYLGERGIIKRDETSENRIIPGDKWNDRPQQ